MRLFSATTNSTLCSTNRRPTTLLFFRSSTSTIDASRRPRRSMPMARTMARSPSSTFCICFGPRNKSSDRSSGIRKPKPSACPCTRPGIRSSFSTRHISPWRFFMICASRSMAPRRRWKPSISASSICRCAASWAGFIGTPAPSSTSRIISRLGIGFSYLACSRARWGSARRAFVAEGLEGAAGFLFLLVKLAFGTKLKLFFQGGQ